MSWQSTQFSSPRPPFFPTLTPEPKKVNELSTTIDLDSTLVRAEALFRRFQRLVDTIDKKGTFPAPRAAQGDETAAADTSSAAPPSSSPASPRQQQQQQRRGPPQAAAAAPPPADKMITPQLRKLLSRTVDVLPRQEVAGKGDGFLAGKLR